MATARATVGSVFGVVATTANVVVDTLAIATTTLEAANASVEAWSSKVKIEAKINKGLAEKLAIQNAAIKLKDSRMEVLQLNEEELNQFNMALKEIEELVKK